MRLKDMQVSDVFRFTGVDFGKSPTPFIMPLDKDLQKLGDNKYLAPLGYSKNTIFFEDAGRDVSQPLHSLRTGYRLDMTLFQLRSGVDEELREMKSMGNIGNRYHPFDYLLVELVKEEGFEMKILDMGDVKKGGFVNVEHEFTYMGWSCDYDHPFIYEAIFPVSHFMNWYNENPLEVKE